MAKRARTGRDVGASDAEAVRRFVLSSAGDAMRSMALARSLAKHAPRALVEQLMADVAAAHARRTPVDDAGGCAVGRWQDGVPGAVMGVVFSHLGDRSRFRCEAVCRPWRGHSRSAGVACLDLGEFNMAIATERYARMSAIPLDAAALCRLISLKWLSHALFGLRLSHKAGRLDLVRRLAAAIPRLQVLDVQAKLCGFAFAVCRDARLFSTLRRLSLRLNDRSCSLSFSDCPRLEELCVEAITGYLRVKIESLPQLRALELSSGVELIGLLGSPRLSDIRAGGPAVDTMLLAPLATVLTSLDGASLSPETTAFLQSCTRLTRLGVTSMSVHSQVLITNPTLTQLELPSWQVARHVGRAGQLGSLPALRTLAVHLPWPDAPRPKHCNFCSEAIHVIRKLLLEAPQIGHVGRIEQASRDPTDVVDRATFLSD
jgi:hypothetical protein